jgi:hypothetical protein
MIHLPTYIRITSNVEGMLATIRDDIVCFKPKENDMGKGVATGREGTKWQGVRGG